MVNLFKSLSDYNNSLEKSKQSYSGLLGLMTDGERRVQHPSRNGFVYVRLRDNLSEVLLAFNEKVSPVYDLPVIIERKNNLWYVVGRDIDRYQNWGTSAPFLPKHGAQHSFNRDENTGGDIVPIYPDQFMPLLVYPSGTMGAGNLIVAPYMLQRDSDFIYVGNTGTINVLGYKPTNNQAILGLVYLDTVSGNPGVLIGSGTPFSASITGSSQIYPYIPYPPSTDYQPLYAFRLVSGTQSLTWDNLYNVRQFIGGQGGGGALPSLDPARVVYTDPSTGDMKTSDELIFNETDDTLTTGDPDGSGDGDGSYLHGLGGDKTHAGVLSTFHNLVTYAGGNARAGLVKLITSLGTKASPLAVTLGTLLGRLRFAGYDGDTRVVDSATSADVKAIATEDFDPSGHGTKVVISTTPNNSTTMQDVAEFDHDGQMILNEYGVGLFSGTVAKGLGVDSNGNVIETSPASGVFELIADTTLGSDTANFDFTSIPSTYKHLKLIYSLRTDRAAASDRVKVIINNDTGSNKYESILYFWFDPNTWGTIDNGSTTYAACTFVCANTALANSFGGGFIEFPDYANTTNLKLFQTRGGQMQSTAIQPEIYDGMAVWRDTSAISRITVAPIFGSNFKAGSRITLYGIK